MVMKGKTTMVKSISLLKNSSNILNKSNSANPNFKGTVKKQVVENSLKVASAAALAYGVAQLSLNNSEEQENKEVDRIGEGFDSIYFKNMAKEMFSGKKAMQPLENLTNAEYNRLIPDVYNIKKHSFDINKNIIYPNIPHKYLGLLPYCGYDDISLQINQYLSDRNIIGGSEYFVNGNLNKSCSTLDYSLKELDNEFGKYNGVVYRVGYFSPNTPQFYSTSNKPLLDKYVTFLESSKLNDYKDKEESEKIHIIKSNNGHKIYEFQDKYCKPKTEDYNFVRSEYLAENEILLDRHSKYQKAEENNDLLEEKKKLAEKLLPMCKEKNIEGWQTLEDVISKIEIWEEI